MPTKRLNGSEMLIEALRLEGIKVIFGYPGGAVLNVYDEIYKQNHFKHILTRHEQGAIHAADGYARASGEVGVAIITSGPGFTNAVTGIATAYTDSIPLVIISGQVPISQIGTDAFQEIDAVGISRPCTKHNFLVKNIGELPRILKEAFYIARSGRPGPVLVDLPKDISATYGEFQYPDEVSLRTYKPTTKGNSRQIKKVIEGLKSAKKPLFYIGGGAVISGAATVVKQLIEKTQVPFLETLMARGIIPDSHPLFLGMVGMHGSYAANMAMCECDFLICVGARFDDRVTGKVSEFAKHAKIVHIDIDPSSIGKIIDVNFPVVGDVKSVCEDMLEMLIAEDYQDSCTREWVQHLEKYKKLHPLKYSDSDEVLKPQWVIEKIGQILGDRALIVTDVGQHQMWAAQFYPFSFSRQFITSGGLGTMGFGLPASMGAKLAAQEKVVVNITGDGSILMNIQELMTCVEEKIPVINVILNNNYLGMVRQWQSFFYESRFSHTDLSLQPDFIKLIEAFGGKGYLVQNKAEFEQAFQEAVNLGVVCMLDVVVDRMEHVLPMVPGGAPLNKMILE